MFLSDFSKQAQISGVALGRQMLAGPGRFLSGALGRRAGGGTSQNIKSGATHAIRGMKANGIDYRFMSTTPLTDHAASPQVGWRTR